ncbi:SDR family NAD(P)-dependent oxidoreductase [Zavarzinia sp. CC-PAN008]|uniref:SDR family NAD(P)-dependent oxidoreductase n=1 Tax=Zavarzinia sp. CC-PAN008 TaxID=3243332 RepID=UPI003F7482F1
MSLFDLKGRIAVVTGSSRGIGKSIALNMAAAGATVVVSSRKAPACEAVAEEIRSAGGQAVVIPCNISDKAQVEGLVDKTVEQFGRIDALVCNAASNPYYGPLTGLDDAVFDKIMRNNVLSNLWLCNRAQPHMAKQGDGAIVIVSSIGGLRGSPVLGTYAMSKAADMQLARNLAVEWGRHNIRVNTIAPGLIKTDFARALWENPQIAATMGEKAPLRRLGEPDDIGGIAVMLCAAAGRFITGQVIVADGGVTIAEGA